MRRGRRGSGVRTEAQGASQPQGAGVATLYLCWTCVGASGPGSAARADFRRLKLKRGRVDRRNTVLSATPALVALGRRSAAFAGALTALVSLLHHVRVSVACLRGAVAFAVVVVLFRAVRFTLERSLAADRAGPGRGVQP